MNQQHKTNSAEQIIVNTSALLALMMPEGISRIAVLGFLASKCLSRYLLNAIAADLANTMHKTTNPNFNAMRLRGIVTVPSNSTLITLPGNHADNRFSNGKSSPSAGAL